ncbi:hypothetical protein VKT23_018180 [Stygiomarasmius scandens]|uniref:Crinkler effector protein N-terminal domain-containing protein n=1 Tax=Marasmiellus scandens TaxID=2682957 RepID=A0ABR1IUI6_9AGAR
MNRSPSLAILSTVTLFPVRIPGSHTVGELKEKIKEKNSDDLKGPNAHKLDLFKVSIPSEDDLVQELNDAVDCFDPLDPIAKLLTIFPDEPPDGIIHIAAKPSTIVSLLRLVHLPLFTYSYRQLTLSSFAIQSDDTT